MKANEFIKKFGFKEAQRVVRKAEEGATIYVLGNVPFYDDSTLSDHVVLDDLRHFVESHAQGKTFIGQEYDSLKGTKEFLGHRQEKLEKRP